MPTAVLKPKNPQAKLASIIITSWNNYSMTKKCIERILENTNYPNYEIWLVDNGSTDQSYEKLAKEFPFLKTIKISPNKGFAYALNEGYRAAKGFYISHVNNDALVLKDWLSEAIEVMESDKNLAIVGCKEVSLETSNDKNAIEELRGKPNIKKMTVPVAWVTKKSVIGELGYLDTEFFSPSYGEEADWNFRARNLGYKIIIASKSMVVHLGSQDIKRMMGNKKQFILSNFHRHRAMLFNLSIVDLLRFAPGLSLIFLTSFTNGTFFYLLESYWMTLKDWRVILNQRKKKRAYIPFKEPTFTLI